MLDSKFLRGNFDPLLSLVAKMSNLIRCESCFDESCLFEPSIRKDAISSWREQGLVASRRKESSWFQTRRTATGGHAPRSRAGPCLSSSLNLSSRDLRNGQE